VCLSTSGFFLSSTHQAQGANYQYISTENYNWWGRQKASDWSGTPWDGLPAPNGPTGSDNLDLNTAIALKVTGDLSVDVPGSFTASINNITVTEFEGLAQLSSRNNWVSTLNVLGNITLNENRMLRLYNVNTLSSLTVNVDGNITIGTGGTLMLGALATGDTAVSTSNNKLTGIAVAGKTTVSGTLLNSSANLVDVTSIFLGDLELKKSESQSGSLTIATVGEDSTAAGSPINKISIRSLSGEGNLYGTNIKTNETRNATLNIQTEIDSNAVFSGTLVDSQVVTTGTNRLHITISGTGQQTFSGANTYTGQTLISSGKLLVNGTHIQATAGVGASASTGLYQVQEGGILGGNGRIKGNITSDNANLIYVESGGILAPGKADQLGALIIDGGLMTSTSNVSPLQMAEGAEFAFRLAGDGSDADRLTFWNYTDTKSIKLNDNTIHMTLLGPLLEGTYTVTLFDFFSDDGITATTSNLLSGLAIHAGLNISNASLIYNANDISVQYTVIPEPSHLALFAWGFLASIVFIRRFSKFSRM